MASGYECVLSGVARSITDADAHLSALVTNRGISNGHQFCPAEQCCGTSRDSNGAITEVSEATSVHETAMNSLFKRCVCASLATALLLGAIGNLEAQTILSRPITKEVAHALQQENQASVLAAQGRTAEAEALFKQSLATIERSLPNDPILAGSLNNVGQFFRSQRRLSEAAELFNRALAIYVVAYGDNHTLTVTVINNLAGTYLADSKFDAAEPLYKRGLAATEKLLGPDHFAVAINLDWLAQTHFFQGRYTQAEENLRRGLAVAEKSKGPDSQLVVRLLDHLISVLLAQGRKQDAAAIKNQAQRIIATKRGPQG